MIIPKSQERLEVAAQTPSRNRYISTSGSCLNLLSPHRLTTRSRKDRKGREPTAGIPMSPSFVVSVPRLPCLLVCLSLSDSSRSFLSSKGSKLQVDSLNLKSMFIMVKKKFIMKWPLFIRGRHIIFFLKNVTSQANLYPSAEQR